MSVFPSFALKEKNQMSKEMKTKQWVKDTHITETNVCPALTRYRRPYT